MKLAVCAMPSISMPTYDNNVINIIIWFKKIQIFQI